MGFGRSARSPGRRRWSSRHDRCATTDPELCHHAEAIANVKGKRYHEYDCPIQCGRLHRVDPLPHDGHVLGSLPYWDRPDLEVESASDAGPTGGGRRATSESKIDNCPLVLVDAPERPWRSRPGSSGPTSSLSLEIAHRVPSTEPALA